MPISRRPLIRALALGTGGLALGGCAPASGSEALLARNGLDLTPAVSRLHRLLCRAIAAALCAMPAR